MADDGVQPQMKSVEVRQWLLLNSVGAQIWEAGKHAVMRRTGLTGRDLRVLDPSLSHPCCIVGRERAMIVNVEQIKAIIMANEVLLLNFKDPALATLVEELPQRILHHQDLSDQSDEEEPLLEEDRLTGKNRLPFEFAVLEACLELACVRLDCEVSTLEDEAYPALEELSTKITTLNLEKVHKIKSRSIEITQRAQKVRDELERLLDDDEAMSRMYLTEKRLQMEHDISSAILADEEHGGDPDVIMLAKENSYCVDLLQKRKQGLAATDSVSRRTLASDATKISSCRNKEVETFLETYFVQIDGALSRLSSLRECVDDTEDYIKIMLDDKRNNLMEMVIKLMAASIALSCFMIVDAVLSINIHIDVFNDSKPPNKVFLWMTCGASFGAFWIFVVLNWWFKFKGYLRN